MRGRLIFTLVASGLLYAQGTNDLMEGFDETPSSTTEAPNTTDASRVQEEAQTPQKSETKTPLVTGLTGKLTQQLTYAYVADTPHDHWNSTKSSLFLDYEYKFENDIRVKVNARAYYNMIYDLRDERYSAEELHEFRSEVELFDAYIEGSISDTLDFKVGRQVVVWGRSDTIRITDILNPLDNRIPGMVDIEDLRLPRAMMKLDYFLGEWRVTPIVILEQRFSKNAPYQSAFDVIGERLPGDEELSNPSYALSVGGIFSGWDLNFYMASVYSDAGYLDTTDATEVKHNKIMMYGIALNVLEGEWLFKSEVAHFRDLQFTPTQAEQFARTDSLVGVEYRGISDTTVSYEISLRHVHEYDKRLRNGSIAVHEDTYQHALRITSEFMNASLTGNYLLSLYGEKGDEGGFQRLWAKYELGEGLHTSLGVVDYIGGATLFDKIKDNDMVFGEITYSF